MSSLGTKPDAFLDGNTADVLTWWQPGLLDQAARTVRAAWSAWTHDWISASIPGSGGCTCTLAHQSPSHAEVRWDPIGTRGKAAAWIEVRHNPIENVQEAIFGLDHQLPAPPDAREGMATAVAHGAWAALAGTLRDCLSLDCDDAQPRPPLGAFKPWSGCVVVSPPNGGPLAHSLLLNAECVRVLLQLQGIDRPAAEHAQHKRIDMTPLQEALAGHKLLIQAELATCEIDLGDLENLGIGDIVPLSHPLDEPLRISTPVDGPFCAAFLGRHAGSKAIELVREPPALRARPIDHHPQEKQ